MDAMIKTMVAPRNKPPVEYSETDGDCLHSTKNPAKGGPSRADVP